MNPDPPANARCFLDANIFVYHFVRNPRFSPPCWDFMQRIQAGELSARYPSPLMISEALHRIMLSEVQTRFGAAKPLAYVQGHPSIIGQLAGYHAAAEAVGRLAIDVLPIDAAFYLSVSKIATQHALLTDDASTVALMQREGLQYLATNDDDFRHVPGITVCKPQ